MEIQQQKLSALSAGNVSTIVFSQNKIKSPVSKCFTNINHPSYTSSSYGIASLSTQLGVIATSGGSSVYLSAKVGANGF